MNQHGTGAMMPPHLTERIERFAKEWMGHKGIHSCGYGAGHNGPAVIVYGEDPAAGDDLPEEFEGWEVLFHVAGRPVAQ